MITDKIEAFLADRGYDADAIREELAKAEVEAVISAKSNRKSPLRMTEKSTVGETSSSASSTNSRTGAGSPPVTTKPKSHTSASSPSHQSNH
jgi:IS5 family transposase